MEAEQQQEAARLDPENKVGGGFANEVGNIFTSERDAVAGAGQEAERVPQV